MTSKKPIIPAGRPGLPNPIDIHVGGRMRLRRTILGMSQQALAQSLGLTFQQIQKYERGLNRVGASRLYDLSRVLDVSISFFFEDMGDETKDQSPRLRAGLEDITNQDDNEYESDPLNKRETLELVRAYYRIKDVDVRDQVFQLCKAIAKSHRLGPGRPASDEG